jgi:hypothetical protein
MDSLPLSLSGAITPDQMSSSSTEEGQTEGAELQVISDAIAYPTPHDLIKETDVRRAFVQLYKNDDKYKLKVRFNLILNGQESDADFIAPLTTDRRNFKKYMPEECGNWFIDWSDKQVKDVKEKIGVKAYRGKFHQAQEFKTGRKVITQIEPWCQGIVWYNPEDKNWSYIINFYEFCHMGSLSDQGITLQQKKGNLHRQDIWTNPLHDQRVRPQTWAQKLAGGKTNG